MRFISDSPGPRPRNPDFVSLRTRGKSVRGRRHDDLALRQTGADRLDRQEDCVCDVAGPVGRVEAAFEFLQDREIDGAVVDINLHGDPSFPVCHELQRRKVPFFFLSGYDSSVIPDAFRTSRLLSKPVDRRDFRTALADFRPIEAVHRGQRTRLGNALIDSLADPGFWALKAKLERVSLKPGRVLHGARQPIAHVYFPIEGLVSLVARGARGRRLEVGLVGSEGITGAEALLEGSAVTSM